VYVDVRDTLLHGGGDVEVRGPGQVRVDTPLHAHFRRTGLPGLLGTVGHLVEGERVGAGVGTALRDRAESAARVTDIGEVDVACHDVGDVVADRVLPYPVGQIGQGLQFGAVGVQQSKRLVITQFGRVGLGAAPRRCHFRIEATRYRAPAVHPGAQLVPVPVDGVEVTTTLPRTALGVDTRVQVGTARGDQDRLRFLPGATHHRCVLH